MIINAMYVYRRIFYNEFRLLIDLFNFSDFFLKIRHVINYRYIPRPLIFYIIIPDVIDHSLVIDLRFRPGQAINTRRGRGRSTYRLLNLLWDESARFYDLWGGVTSKIWFELPALGLVPEFRPNTTTIFGMPPRWRPFFALSTVAVAIRTIPVYDSAGRRS
jgi:hypothetical protein